MSATPRTAHYKVYTAQNTITSPISRHGEKAERLCKEFPLKSTSKIARPSNTVQILISGETMLKNSSPIHTI